MVVVKGQSVIGRDEMVGRKMKWLLYIGIDNLAHGLRYRLNEMNDCVDVERNLCSRGHCRRCNIHR